ncbi:MAG: AMP-binding protein [Pyrinomonadaceae bacterium]|nr:AMP-binding protein [Pyrinomonadaceae bacterium]
MNESNPFEDQAIAWEPTQEVIDRAQLTKFMKQVGASDWDDLYAKSIEDVEAFTEEVLKFLDIKFDPPYEKLLDTSEGIEWSKWCVGAGLNITEMCLDRWMGTEVENQPAIIWEGEEGNEETLTFFELLVQVDVCAAGLLAEGLTKGDAIGIHLPMNPETVITLLAINRIGAIAIPVFSGYGVEAIASRMNAVKAKALFAIGGFPRRGRLIPVFKVAMEAAQKCPTIQKVIVLGSKHRIYSEDERKATAKKQEDAAREEYSKYLKLNEAEKAEHKKEQKLKFEKKMAETFQDMEAIGVPKEKIEEFREKISSDPSGGGIGGVGSIDLLPDGGQPNFNLVGWEQLQETGKTNLDTLSEIPPTNANDPAIILYSSGTTGRPKGIAHVHCGFPIKAAQDMAFGTDVGKGTRISWVTDIGWMMGPWLIYGALINGATMVLYDGSPDYPNPDRMWEFSAKHKVEVLGISPTLIRVLSTKGDELPKKHDLSSLRAFASTGEPWNPEPWRWLFEKVGDGKLPIINYSGGTEISGGILMGNPLLPQKPGSFPAPCPGMNVDILDEDGESVEKGEVGELSIKDTWIGMARGFWEENERYLETYWSRFDKTWVHGDFAMQDKDGHWYILGRSDDTLNVAGKRVGPAEIESLLVADERIAEAAVIGVPDEIKGTAMVAFCVVAGTAGDPPAMSAAREQNSKDFKNDQGISTSDDVDAGESPAVRLEKDLKSVVAKDMGKPLTPKRIHFVSALSKTRNGKVMRRVIRSAYLGEDAGDLSALENPETVDEIGQL